MKTLLSFVAVFVALTIFAQPPPAETQATQAPVTTSVATSTAADAAARAEFEQLFPEKVLKPRRPPIVYSGALVNGSRTNFLQLINPRAPRRYGHGYDNVSVDLVTGRAQGIRLFTVSF